MAPIFIEVGGRLIARWGTGAKKYQNYCTDVTGSGGAVHDATDGQGDYETHVAKWGEIFAKKDQENGINSELSAYTKKALRVVHISTWISRQWSGEQPAVLI